MNAAESVSRGPRYVTRRLAVDQAIPSTSKELEPSRAGRDTVAHKGAARVKATKARVLRQWPHKCVREGGRCRGAKARGCTCFSVHHAACHPRYFTALRTVLCIRGTSRPRGSIYGGISVVIERYAVHRRGIYFAPARRAALFHYDRGAAAKAIGFDVPQKY